MFKEFKAALSSILTGIKKDHTALKARVEAIEAKFSELDSELAGSLTGTTGAAPATQAASASGPIEGTSTALKPTVVQAAPASPSPAPVAVVAAAAPAADSDTVSL